MSAQDRRLSAGTRLELTRVLGRELVRAATVPLQLMLFVLRRRTYVRRSAEVLAAQGGFDRAAADREARAAFRAVLGGRPLRHVYLACGEASGERHALRIVEALRAASPGLRVSGMGGEALAAAGVEVGDRIVDRAVMGLSGALRELPFFVGVVGRFIEGLRRERVDAVVLVDNPGLNLVLAERARAHGVPVLYFVCPQYWAWAPWRMRRFRRAVGGAIAILPFEQPLFHAAGVPTAAAGHPLRAHRPPLAAEPREPSLLLLPGSRRAELDAHLEGMLRLFARFRARRPEARALLPQPDPTRLAGLERRVAALAAHGVPTEGVTLVAEDAYALAATCRAALVKSGTSALQTGLARCPLVVVYRVRSRLAKALGHLLLTVPWIAAPNLVLGRPAFRELLFSDDHGWDEALTALDALWDPGPTRTASLEALDTLAIRLEGPAPEQVAADWLLDPGP
ncbi:MAG: hypothetical protein R3F30_16275 [Planctomycetota bacterium]